MRTVILLTLVIILAVTPIYCWLYFNCWMNVDARLAVQKILNTIENAAKINNRQLYLSVFDKNFRAISCDRTTATYDDFESISEVSKSFGQMNVKLINAVIEDDHLKFEILDENDGDSGKKFVVTAVRHGADFKVITSTLEGEKCF